MNTHKPDRHPILKMRGLKTPQMHSSNHDHHEELENEFTLLTWNCNKQGNSFHWRKEFAHLCEEISPSLMLMQELNVSQSLAEHLKVQRLHFGFSPNLYLDKAKGHHVGVATLSTAKSHHHVSQISSVKEPFLRTPKSSIASYFYLPNGDELCVINIHAINFVSNSAFHEQLHKVHEVLSTINGPLIVAGDFNSWNSKRIEILKQQFAHFPKHRLKEVKFNEEERQHIKRAPSFITWLFGDYRLDRIFYSSGSLSVVTTSAKVHHMIHGTKMVSSDHKPLSCRFKVLGKKEPLNVQEV